VTAGSLAREHFETLEPTKTPPPKGMPRHPRVPPENQIAEPAKTFPQKKTKFFERFRFFPRVERKGELCP
jgi:hypothetical protein